MAFPDQISEGEELTCGIYQLIAPNGKSYIGSSVNIESRIKSHETIASAGRHINKKLNRAYKKYGFLHRKILLVCSSEELLIQEQYFIDEFQPEYNCSKIAGRVQHTDEIREKISRSHLGKRLSDEHKAKISAAKSGKRLSDEHKAKISAGQNRPETLARQRAAKIGRRLSEEHKAKINIVKTGLLPRLIAIHTGRKCSPETRKRMKISQQLRRAREKVRTNVSSEAFRSVRGVRAGG